MQRVRKAELADPDRKRAYNRQMFAVIAPRYDAVTRLLSFGRDRAWKRRLVSLLPDRDDCDALDLACGTGDILQTLARRYTSGRVVGLDLSSDMIRRARRRSAHDRPLEVVEASMDCLPFAGEAFDVVTGGYALRNAPDLNGVLAEVHRVLRPGGIGAFLDFSHGPRGVGWLLQRRLLRFWGQFWGLLLHGDPEVYAYISRSLEAYPDRGSLASMIRSVGFTEIRARSFMSGFLALTSFRKPA